MRTSGLAWSVLLVASMGGTGPEAQSPSLVPSHTARAGKSSTLETIRQRGRLIVGTEPKFKLFNGKNPVTGDYDGFLVDISKALARALLGDESRLEIRAVSDDDRIPSVETGAVDMIIDTTGPVSTNPTGPSANKNERVDFSDEVYNSGSALLVRKGSRIKNLDDITEGTRVLYVKANPDTRFIRAKAPTASYVGFGDTGDAFKALEAGHGDVLAQVDTRLYELATRHPDYVVVGKFTNRPDCIMIKKGDHELREYLNGFIASLKASGEYDRLYRKWFKIAESEWRVR